MERERSVEQWIVRGATFVLVIHADGRGWEIYTPLNSNDIGATLRDATARLGLVFVGDDGRPEPEPAEGRDCG